MLSVKQGGIKYYFLSLWYDSTWDWTQVSRTIGEHSKHYANVQKGKILTAKAKVNCLTELKKFLVELGMM